MNLFHQRLAAAALAASALLMSGCYSFRYTTHRPIAAGSSEQVRNTFMNGVVDPGGPVNVSALCPGGFALVEHQVTFPNALLSALVQAAVALVPGAGPFAAVLLMMWTPSTVRVQCIAGPPRASSAPPPALPPEERRQLANR